MPSKLKKMYEKRDWFPVESGFQAAYSVKGVFSELSETTVVPCREIKVGTRTINRMSVQSYSYDPSFAPEGECIVQVSIRQNEEDFAFWKELAADKTLYSAKKRELAAELEKRAEEAFPCIAGKTEVCDVWTPVSYASRCNAYRGAYMSFISAVNSKGSALMRDKAKGVKNLLLASQWVMGPADCRRRLRAEISARTELSTKKNHKLNPRRTKRENFKIFTRLSHSACKFFCNMVK